MVAQLASELCRSVPGLVPDEPQGRGRPSLPLAAIITSAVIKRIPALMGAAS